MPILGRDFIQNNLTTKDTKYTKAKRRFRILPFRGVRAFRGLQKSGNPAKGIAAGVNSKIIS
jgi:hypothetical protein